MYHIFFQVITALQEVDDAIGLFMENLVHDDVTDCFDIVIASTNGQLDVSCENTTYFDTVCVRIKTKRSKTEHFVNRTFFKSRLSFSSVNCYFFLISVPSIYICKPHLFSFHLQILPNTLFYDTTTHGMNSMGFITPTDQCKYYVIDYIEKYCCLSHKRREG